MENDVNIAIEEFKLSIINLLNESNMPIGMIYYIMKDVFGEITEEYQNYLNTVMKKRQAEAAAMAASQEPEAVTEEIVDNDSLTD